MKKLRAAVIFSVLILEILFLIRLILPQPIVLGDANGNNVVDSSDYENLCDEICNSDEQEKEFVLRNDLNHDGTVDAFDAAVYDRNFNKE